MSPSTSARSCYVLFVLSRGKVLVLKADLVEEAACPSAD